MEAKTVTIEDIKNLVDGKMVVKMPDFKSTVAARNQVSYARGTISMPAGKDLRTSTDRTTATITISVVDKSEDKK